MSDGRRSNHQSDCLAGQQSYHGCCSGGSVGSRCWGNPKTGVFCGSRDRSEKVFAVEDNSPALNFKPVGSATLSRPCGLSSIESCAWTCRGWPPQTLPRPSSSLRPAGFDSRLRGGILVPTGGRLTVLNLVGMHAPMRPCGGFNAL